jgi:putative DNA primase/helicase
MSRVRKGRVILSPDTPLNSAHIFLESERPNLLRHQEQWYDYNGAAYGIVENETIKQSVQQFLERATKEVHLDNGKKQIVPFNPKPSHTNGVVEMLGNDVHRPCDKATPPCFLDGGEGDYAGLDPRKIISCTNGLLYIPTRKLLKHTPQFFTLNAIPVKYDPKVKMPRKWLRFLLETMKGRKPLCRLLQEAIGYSLDTDTSLQKILFLWGRPGSGKGTLMRVLEALAGEGNCSHPSIGDLGNTFGLEHAIHKTIMMITDMSIEQRLLRSAADVLKAVSGEDTRNFNRKNKLFWHGKLRARIWLGGNRLPNFGDDMIALARRLLVVPFEVSFVDKEDFELTNKLLTELPGILNWALDGLSRLRKRGRFLDLPESIAAKKRMLYLSDPVRGFVETRCVLRIETARTRPYMVLPDVLYNEYVAHCTDDGIKSPLAKNKFGEALMDCFPAIKNVKRVRADGRQVHVYVGIKLSVERAIAVYRHDPFLLDLHDGVRCQQTIMKDADGFPMSHTTAGAIGSIFPEDDQ